MNTIPLDLPTGGLHVRKSLLFHQPNGGDVAEVTFVLMPRARWERHWAARMPHMRAIVCGPLIAAIGLTI